MRLGPGLLLLPLLNPVIVAEETATLDWLTGGNAIIGLGLGYRQEEFDSIGVPYQGARAALRRGRRGDPQAVARRRRRAQRPLTTRSSKVQASLKPKQPGGPPIWMAGDSEVAGQARGQARRRLDALADGERGGRRRSWAPCSARRARRPAWRRPPSSRSSANAMSAAAPARRSTRCASRCPSSTRPMRAGAAPRASCRPTASAPTSTSSPPTASSSAREDEVVEQIGRYGERTGTDHILLRVQWPGLDQKTAVHTLERLGRVVEQLG